MRRLRLHRAGGRLRRWQEDPASQPSRKLTAAELAIVGDIHRLLAASPQGRVAVVTEREADSPCNPLARVLAASVPRAVVSVVPLDDESARHAQLAADGPFRAIAVGSVAARDSPDLAALYRSSLFHLEPGGKLFVADIHPSQPAPQGLWPLLTRIVALREKGVEPCDADEDVLARATRKIEVTGRRLVVTNGIASLPKLTEAETTYVVRRRGRGFASVITHFPAESFTSRGVIRDHRERTETRDPERVCVPPISLREYSDAYCLPRQIVVAGGLLVADTYRHHLWSRLATSGTIEVGPRFASVPDDLGAARKIDGTVFQFDSEWSGHFGHLLTEQLARLWAYHTAKERHPDLRPILFKKVWTQEIAPWERGLLESAGIPADDALVIAGAIRPRRVLAATPMFSHPQYASPRIVDIWDEVGRGAARLAGPVETPRRIFVSRRRKGRWCRNGNDVEAEFAAAGFAIVYPEDLPFPEQVVAFRNAEVIAGYAGSGMFTSMLCGRPARILLICSEGYIPHNERLITAVRGHEVDIFWSVPDHWEINGPFRFDFDREGRCLRETLAQLD
jgi:capsular polysaccharide biosynthesis protein